VKNAQSYRFRGQQAPSEAIRAEVTAKIDGQVATIRLYDVIDSFGGMWGVSAKEFASTLDNLGSSVNQINLHINSPGGEAFEGIAILNLLRAHPARVTAIVDGLAGSAASFIATGADETLMAKNSQLMIHDAWGLVVGNAKDMRDIADALDKMSDNIASIYADKASGTVQEWRDAMRDETWYLADEAVEAGLADGLIEKPADDAQNRFDLTIFAHNGRADAPEPFIPAKAAEPESAAPAANSPVTAGLIAGISEAEAVLALG
jgi:ATP-dependent protease ClpP protease subunit